MVEDDGQVHGIEERRDKQALLLKRLLAAKKDMPPVYKDAQNPHLKNHYASLGAVLEAVEGVLAKHGLVIVQTINGATLVTAIYDTETGESLASAYPLKPVKDDPQGMGSAITYARRYSLMAMLSLTAEDDDGNAASHSHFTEAKTPPQEFKGVAPVADLIPPPATHVANHVPDGAAHPDWKLITLPQQRRLFAIAQAANRSEGFMRTLIAKHGFESSRKITKDKYQAICDDTENLPPEETEMDEQARRTF